MIKLWNKKSEFINFFACVSVVALLIFCGAWFHIFPALMQRLWTVQNVYTIYGLH